MILPNILKKNPDHLFIAAAGNDTWDHSRNRRGYISYPCDHAEVYCVASTDNRDEYSLFSDYGDCDTCVDIAAPGSGILSTTPKGVRLRDGSLADYYESFSGTSMATPHVAGLAALIQSVRPDLTPTQIKEVMTNTGDKIQSKDERGRSGRNTKSNKRINAFRAIESIRRGGDNTTTRPPDTTTTTTTTRNTTGESIVKD